jgi:hypothetical protein
MTRRNLNRTLLAALLAAGLVPVAAAHVGTDDRNAVVDDVANALTTSPKRLQPEPTIGIDPNDLSIVAAGAQDFRKTTELNVACVGNRWNGLYLSTDGGVTFPDNRLVPGYFTDTSGEQDESEMFGLCLNTDPVIVFDDQEHMYYSHIAFNDVPRGTTTPSTVGALYVSVFDRDDDTYQHTTTVKVPSSSGNARAPEIHEVGPGSSNFDDKQWMTVDLSRDSDFYGRVYVTWTKFGAQGGQSAIWISHCGGDSFGESCADELADGGDFSDGVIVNRPVAGGLVQESFPAVAPNGDVYVAFLQFQGGFGSDRPHSGIWIAKSTDGGETFTQQRITPIRQIPSPIPPQGTAANDGNNSFRTGTAPGVAVTDNGHVHVVWGEWVNNNNAEIKYTRSTNGGTSWEPIITLNDDSTGHEFFPAIDSDGNNVHVAWYDGVNPAGQTITQLNVAYITFADGAGAALAADDRLVTDAPFNPNTVSRFPVFCAAFIGDYIDIDAVNGKVAIVWNDNRNVVDPLTPAECADFRTRPADPTIQADLNDGSLDQDTFVEIDP